MKINNNRINFLRNSCIHNTADEKHFQKYEKNIEASSLDALSVQGMAFMNLSFSGKHRQAAESTDITEIKELTAKEFKAYKKKLFKRLNDFPLKLQYEAKFWELNKYNIQIANKIFFDEKLYNNALIINGVSNILWASQTPETAQAKSDFLDRIFSEKRLYGNEKFINKLEHTFFNPQKHKETQAKFDIIGKILSDKRLYGNEEFMNNAGDIVRYTQTPEQAKVKSDIIDKLLSEKGFQDNIRFMDFLCGIPEITNTPEQYELANKIFSEEKLYNNENFLDIVIRIIDSVKTKEEAEAKFNISNKIYSDKRLYNNKSIKNYAEYIIRDVKTPEQAQAKSDIIDRILSVERLYNNENIKNKIGVIISETNNQEQVKIKSDIIDSLLSDEKELYKNENVMQHAGDIIYSVNNPEQYKLAEKILLSEELHNNKTVMNKAGYIISNVNNTGQYIIANQIFDKEELYNNKNFMETAGVIIKAVNSQEQCQLANTVLSVKELCNDRYILEDAASIIKGAKNPGQYKLAEKVLSKEELYTKKYILNDASSLIAVVESPEQYEIANKILSEEELYTNKLIISNAEGIISSCHSPEQFEIANKILSDKNLYTNDNIIVYAQKLINCIHNSNAYNIVNRILSEDKLYTNTNIIKNIKGLNFYASSPFQYELINRFVFDERLNTKKNLMESSPAIVQYTETPEQAEAKFKIIDKITSDDRIYANETFMNKANIIISYTETPEQAETKSKIIDILLSEDKKFYNNPKIMNIAYDIVFKADTKEQVSKIENALNLFNSGEITIEQILRMIYCKEEISGSQLKELNDLMGIDKTSELSADELVTAINFIEIVNKKNISEIPIKAKHEFLKNLVSSDSNLFNIKSDIIREYFPLLPKNQEEYSALLPELVKSMGIETNALTSKQISGFNQDITALSKTLASLTDKDFINLQISQKYGKDKFISDVWKTVKDLPFKEQQKIYDYFCFELYENPEVPSKHSITGYPFYSHNENKLAQITDERTINALNSIISYTDKFNKNNPVICNNKEIEDLLNKIINVLPELRTQIGKFQAGNVKENGLTVGSGSHDYDIFKHSLKVMQKITQDGKYNNLNESDKKIMLLASLLHDITKPEGDSDHNHAKEGSFDSFFIAKKFNLTRDEEIKLNELIRHHEWLGYVNSSEDKNELTKRLKDTAYDLRHDNMLELSLIFTHADLKAVRNDDSFHDRTDGRGRRVIDGQIRSFGYCADYYAKEIEKLIRQLKPSQPILPVTPFPKASRIAEKITTVNEDGSTNIKGIYKDKEGLIIIKYNELENEDLEKIGFPKGSTVKGIISKTGAGHNVNTGNVKFFAHALDYPNQLTKFDAFSLVDSDALLSVSYAECPEDKYRFYRPQGILLDCDTKFIHGGGETDAGSGCGKNIQEFKDNYIFGGIRQKDRTFISALIKRALKMNNTEYIEFVKNNENKSFVEIEPEEIRTKIIKAFASINSRPRIGNRRYNEMYISNPKPPMAAFAYNINENEEVGNPVKFLDRTTITKQECNYDENGGISVYDRTKFLREYALERDIPFIVFGD